MNQFLIGLLLCTSVSASAQTNASAGYIIKANGDTIHGYLEEEVKSNLVFQVKFKSAGNSGNLQSFNTGDVLGFKYESGNFYKRVTFTNALPDSGYSETVFALVLVEGTYNLLSYTPSEQTYFVITDNHVTYFLYNSVFNANGTMIIEGNYISRLGVIAAECTKQSFNTDQLNYDQKGLAKFIFDLNNCVTPTATTLNHFQTDKTIMELSLFAGGIFISDHRDQFTADAAVRLINPQLSRNVFINVGLHYSHTDHRQTDKEFGSTVVLNTTADDILCAPLTIQYDFTNGFIRPFIYAGFALAYLREKRVYTAYSTYTSPPPDKFGLSVAAAVGLEGRITGNISLRAEWRYELLLQYPAIGLAYNFK